MRPWRDLNGRGKMLICCVILNILIAITIATSGSWLCLLPTGTAIICGLSTYLPRYTRICPEMINDERIKK